MELAQGFKKNNTSEYLVDNKKLFIMPKAENPMLKLVYEGDAQIFEVTDGGVRRDMTYEYEYMTRLGVGVVTNLKFGIWTLV